MTRPSTTTPVVETLDTTPDVVRTETLRRYRRSARGGSLDEIARLARAVSAAPAAAVHVLTDRHQYPVAVSGAAHDAPLPRGETLCQHVLADGEVVAVADASLDDRFAAATAGGLVRFYVGVPLRTADARMLGTLCVYGPEAREVPHGLVDQLQLLAQQAVHSLELAQLVELLAEDASRDPHTGAVHASLLLERLRRGGPSGAGCLALVRLDNVRACRQRHGAEAAEEVVRCAVDRVRAVLRAPDTVARLDLDLLAVLTCDGEVEPRALLGRLREALEGEVAGPAGPVPFAARLRAGTVTAEDPQAQLEAAVASLPVADAKGRLKTVTARRLLPHESNEAIRAWARANGISTSTRSSVSAIVVEAYRAAHRDGAEEQDAPYPE